MPTGEQVQILVSKGQDNAALGGCGFAARHLGAERRAVIKFVHDWDEREMHPEFLLAQLEALWHERLEDAEVTQEVICGVGGRQAEHAL